MIDVRRSSRGSARTDAPRLYRPQVTLNHMNEITTMHSVTRIFARIGGPRGLAIGLAVVCAALASAVWASARPAPSSGATPHEMSSLTR
jgi:hypothetical protein